MLRPDVGNDGSVLTSTSAVSIASIEQKSRDSKHSIQRATSTAATRIKENNSSGEEDNEEYNECRSALAEKAALLRARIAELAKDTSPALERCNAQLAALATLVSDDADSTQMTQKQDAQPRHSAPSHTSDKSRLDSDAAEARQGGNDGGHSEVCGSSGRSWRPAWFSRLVSATAQRMPAAHPNRTPADLVTTEHNTASHTRKHDDALLPFSPSLPPPTVTRDEVDAYLASLTQTQVDALVGHANDVELDGYECLLGELDFDSICNSSEAEREGGGAASATHAVHDTHSKSAVTWPRDMHYDFRPSTKGAVAQTSQGATSAQEYVQGLVPAALITTTSTNALRDTSSATSSSFARVAELTSTQHCTSACTIEVNYDVTGWPHPLAPASTVTADTAQQQQQQTQPSHTSTPPREENGAHADMCSTLAIAADRATGRVDAHKPAIATGQHDVVPPAIVVTTSQPLSQGEHDEDDELNEWSFETFSRRFLGEKEAAWAVSAALRPAAPPPTRHILHPDEAFVLPSEMSTPVGDARNAEASHQINPFAVKPPSAATATRINDDVSSATAKATRADNDNAVTTALAADTARTSGEAAQLEAPQHQQHLTSESNKDSKLREAKEHKLLRRRAYAILLSNKVRERDVALLTTRLRQEARRQADKVARAALPAVTKLVQLMEEARSLLDALATLEHDTWGMRITDSAEFLHTPRFRACCAELLCRLPFSATVRRVTCRRCGQVFCPSCCAECGVGPDVMNEARHERLSLGWERICRRCWNTCAAHQKRVAQERRRRRLITTTTSCNGGAAAASTTVSAVTRNSGTMPIGGGGGSARSSVAMAAVAPATSSRASTVTAVQGSESDEHSGSVSRSRNVEDMTLRSAVLSGAYCGEHRRLQDGLVPFYVRVNELDETTGKMDRMYYMLNRLNGLMLRRLQDTGQLVRDATICVAAHSRRQRRLTIAPAGQAAKPVPPTTQQ